MRDFFAGEIYRYIKKNRKIILLSADIGNRLFDKIKKDFPNNFLNCGIAESNMVTFAAGLSSNGYLPVCYTITNFLIYKSIEQIRNDAIYNNNKIILVGTGSGLSYNHLGPTHHSLEDIGLLNGLPKINILSPADNNNLKYHLEYAISKNNKESSYIRLGKKKEPKISFGRVRMHEVEKISINKKSNVALVSTGPLVNILNQIANKVSNKLKVDVINFHHLKPINKKKIRTNFNKYKKIFSLEEHYYTTGIFSILKVNLPNQIKVQSLNQNLNFVSKIGDRGFVQKAFGIDINKICKLITDEKNRD